MNIDNCKNYATEENLSRALKKLGFTDHRHVVVCNRAGRFTAIFPVSEIHRNGSGYLALYAVHGFLTLG